MDTKPHVFKVKVPLAEFINSAIQDLQLMTLNLTPENSQRFYEIQPVDNHRDIFDRMLIAQAASSNLIMVSTDHKFPQYPIELFE